MEVTIPQQDLKYEQILIEINSIKVEIAKVQGSIIALDDKFALFIQGKIKSA